MSAKDRQVLIYIDPDQREQLDALVERLAQERRERLNRSAVARWAIDDYLRRFFVPDVATDSQPRPDKAA